MKKILIFSIIIMFLFGCAGFKNFIGPDPDKKALNAIHESIIVLDFEVEEMYTQNKITEKEYNMCIYYLDEASKYYNLAVQMWKEDKSPRLDYIIQILEKVRIFLEEKKE